MENIILTTTPTSKYTLMTPNIFVCFFYLLLEKRDVIIKHGENVEPCFFCYLKNWSNIDNVLLMMITFMKTYGRTIKDASRGIRVWWSLYTSFNDGTQLEEISNTISNNIKESVYMIGLLGMYLSFKVWNRGSVNARSVTSEWTVFSKNTRDFSLS